jgi:alkylmercury lyase-like protein
MEVLLLSVPECPGAALLEARLAEALVQGPAPRIRRRMVRDGAQAVALGMAGSPTLLLDGRDPFAEPGRQPSLSCRLYRHDDGRLEGAPSTAQLRRALGAPDSMEARDVWRPGPLDEDHRSLHREILRSFAARGRAPERSDLAPAAARLGLDLGRALAALAAADAIGLDPGGRIGSAYPFSEAPTRHWVKIAGGPEVFAMCAIDALGIGPMLCADAVIRSADAGDGRPVTIRMTAGRTVWEPAGAVALVARASDTGPAAESCCARTNLFADRQAAEAWAEANPGVTGAIVDQETAEGLGRAVFGSLLRAGERGD